MGMGMAPRPRGVWQGGRAGRRAAKRPCTWPCGSPSCRLRKARTVPRLRHLPAGTAAMLLQQLLLFACLQATTSAGAAAIAAAGWERTSWCGAWLH